ncbi:hypothetical protein IOU64_004427 [Salmonella enterica]|nr:hypothetical protein [Salmonella enterica]
MNKQKETAFENRVVKYVLSKTYINYIPQFNVYSHKHGLKKIDFYLPTLKIALEFDEYYHTGFEQIKADRERERVITDILHCEFVRFPEGEPVAVSIRRLEDVLRARNVTFSHYHTERDYLISKIRNCENRIDSLPHLFDFYYERLMNYKAQLSTLERYA